MSTTTPTEYRPRRRETWSGQTAFLLAAIGSAVGLGNIWRFPGVAYANGGGAFLIPYLVALVCVGIPVLLLDYALGHKFRGSPPAALRRLTPKAEFLGWFQVMVCFVIFTYYAVVIAWAARYAIYSVDMAWGEDPKTFFLADFLQVTEATTYSTTPVASVMIPLVLLWLFVLIIMARGLTSGVELANKIFLPLLVVLFIAIVIRALFLPGALDGLNAFFTPTWDSLADPKVWLAAFAQIFYSLSVAFGIMLTYASYLKPKSNLTGTGLVAGFANSSFEILAGIGVFAALGFMAHQQSVPVAELEGLTGPILSFVTFPHIISMMPGGPIFGVLFFTSLVLAGVTSLLSLLQVVSGGLQDKFGYSPIKASFIMGIPAMLVSVVLFGTQSGLNALDVVDNFINTIGVVVCAIALTVVSAVAGKRLKSLRAHLNKVSSMPVPFIWDILVGLVVPAVLSFMLITAVIELLQVPYGGYDPSYIAILGWGCVILALVGAAVLTALPWKKNASEKEGVQA
ncbi:sodium-dependent transporter [Schaalia sp. Marseille-Q2122]|uniref:sodium-dependent transporter n=1 Tax=Schaalia sp. Marseille-Q2122 TaxID=2736604 RepID=UPI00158EF7A9|nr:sodium-dependent transporter [Schaalia sp. Marseille-Q2122]